MFHVFGSTVLLEGQIDDHIIRMQSDARCSLQKTCELLVTGLEPSASVQSVMARLRNPGYKFGEICVYKLIASHLRRPM